MFAAKLSSWAWRRRGKRTYHRGPKTLLPIAIREWMSKKVSPSSIFNGCKNKLLRIASDTQNNFYPWEAWNVRQFWRGESPSRLFSIEKIAFPTKDKCLSAPWFWKGRLPLICLEWVLPWIRAWLREEQSFSITFFITSIKKGVNLLDDSEAFSFHLSFCLHILGEQNRD